MMDQPLISVWNLVDAVTKSMDLVFASGSRHHAQTAYAALRLAEAMGLPEEESRTLVLAASLHDCGSLCLKEKLDALGPAGPGVAPHAYVGCLLLRQLAPFRPAAEAVRFHHLPWRDGAGQAFRGEPVPRAAGVLQLADRIARLADESAAVLADRERIRDAVAAESGAVFAPDTVRGFDAIAGEECFWLDLKSDTLRESLRAQISLPAARFATEDLLHCARFLGHLIDFRSPFTTTHSTGVSAVATALARLAGLSERECALMTVAGQVHDLGRLGVPWEVFEKPGKLDAAEAAAMRAHPYYTARCLEPLALFGQAREWAALHHERVDGGGYPFHLHGRDLPLGARIMCVADVVAACTEVRPYRAGMTRDDVLRVLNRQVAEAALDGDLVGLIEREYSDISSARAAAQTAVRREYDDAFGLLQAG